MESEITSLVCVAAPAAMTVEKWVHDEREFASVLHLRLMNAPHRHGRVIGDALRIDGGHLAIEAQA